MHHLHRIVFCLDILQVVIAKQPNILFILADDFGWNDVGYHGSEIQTPVLDSVKYQNLYGQRFEYIYIQLICILCLYLA